MKHVQAVSRRPEVSRAQMGVGGILNIVGAVFDTIGMLLRTVGPVLTKLGY